MLLQIIKTFVLYASLLASEPHSRSSRVIVFDCFSQSAAKNVLSEKRVSFVNEEILHPALIPFSDIFTCTNWMNLSTNKFFFFFKNRIQIHLIVCYRFSTGLCPFSKKNWRQPFWTHGVFRFRRKFFEQWLKICFFVLTVIS